FERGPHTETVYTHTRRDGIDADKKNNRQNDRLNHIKEKAHPICFFFNRLDFFRLCFLIQRFQTCLHTAKLYFHFLNAPLPARLTPCEESRHIQPALPAL